jgi:DNA-directed RNA polymerase I, II, and III subunit RPABC1
MSDVDVRKVGKLFTMKKNQLKMLRRRGYDIAKEEALLSYTLKEFMKIYLPFAKKSGKSLRTVLSQTYEKPERTDGKTERLYVFFAEEDSKHKQLGVDILGEMISSMDKYRAKNGILITPAPLSSSSKKKIEELLSYNIYTFMENEMTYDPTEHYLTPAHRALSVAEQRDFLSKNNISIDQMPIILSSDMISRYYGFKPGQIIEIKRVNLYETLIQESISYRAVKE